MVMPVSYYEDHKKELTKLNKTIRKLENNNERLDTENKRLVRLLENTEDVY